MSNEHRASPTRRRNIAALGIALAVIAGLLFGTAHLASAAPKALSISGYQQQKSTWCGAAAAQTALTALGVYVSQSSLAKDMGTGDKFGTWPWDMPGPMNAQIQKNAKGAKQKLRYERRTGAGTDQLYAWVTRSIARGVPVIILVKSQNIWYPGAKFGTGHYLVIYGYKDNTAARGKVNNGVYQVYDPWDGKRHNLAAKDWGTGGRNVGYPGGNVIAPKGV